MQWKRKMKIKEKNKIKWKKKMEINHEKKEKTREKELAECLFLDEPNAQSIDDAPLHGN
jgi:hypothetical protein